MRIGELEQLVTHLWKIGTTPANRRYMPVLIWGESGVGKSETIHTVAKRLTAQAKSTGGQPVHVVDLRLGEVEVGDLIGLPREEKVFPDPIAMKSGARGTKLYTRVQLLHHMLTSYPERFRGMSPLKVMREVVQLAEEGFPELIDFRTVYALPEWFPEPNTRGFLFLDEINRAPEDVRQAVFQLLLDRQMHMVKLPPDWIIVSAMNPPTNEYQVQDISDRAFMARFLHIPLIPDAKEWLDYANRKQVDQVIRSLIAGDHKLLGPTSVRIPDIKPTPRSWILLDRILPGLPKNLLREVAVGLLGAAAGDAFVGATEDSRRPLSGKDVLLHLAGPAGDTLRAFVETRSVGLVRVTMDNVLNTIVSDYDSGPLPKPELLNLAKFYRMISDGGMKDLVFHFLRTRTDKVAPEVVRQFGQEPTAWSILSEIAVEAGIMPAEAVEFEEDEWNLDDFGRLRFAGAGMAHRPMHGRRRLALVR